MDIDAASSINQAQTQTKVSYAVAKKVQDAQVQQGDAAIALLESAARAGETIDGRIRQANQQASRSASLDVYA